jgi:multidrug efflux pump subunit AcrB
MRGPLGLFQRFNAVFDKTTVGYMKFTRIVTRKIAIGRGFIVILTASACGLPGQTDARRLHAQKRTWATSMVNIQLPDAASLQRSRRMVTKKVEKSSTKHEEVEYMYGRRVQPALQQHVHQCRRSFLSPSRTGA